MMSNIPFREHVTVILYSVKMNYGDPDFPTMKYITKLFALCK